MNCQLAEDCNKLKTVVSWIWLCVHHVASQNLRRDAGWKCCASEQCVSPLASMTDANSFELKWLRERTIRYWRAVIEGVTDVAHGSAVILISQYPPVFSTWVTMYFTSLSKISSFSPR